MKYDVTIILKALDLSGDKTSDFEKEYDIFAAEIISLVEREVIPEL